MKRLPVIAFGVLVIATIGAFFLTQRSEGQRLADLRAVRSTPAAFNPVSGRMHSCISATHMPINYRQTELNFYAAAADTVGVSIVRSSNTATPVATITSGRSMAKNAQGTFVWNGRLSDGRIAPDGTYYFRIELFRRAAASPSTPCRCR